MTISAQQKHFTERIIMRPSSLSWPEGLQTASSQSPMPRLGL